MRLGELVDEDVRLTRQAAAIEITGLTADSRAVRPGMLFAALPGRNVDGAKFVADAVAAGAAAVLVGAGPAAAQATMPVDAGVPVIADADPRRRLALMAARFFSRQPKTVVAVTGTAGKTSVASFTCQIWQRAGLRAGMIGTLGVKADGIERGGNLTTPDPVLLHRLLAELAAAGVEHAVLEASSHGLDQRRLDGVGLTAGGFTNLGRDHMDYHGDAEDYFAAKMRLFRSLLAPGATAVVDADGPHADRVLAIARERGLDCFSVGEAGRGLRLRKIVAEESGQRVIVEAQGRSHDVLVPLIGRFQVSNALVAAGLAMASGIDAETAVEALRHLRGAPGRLELIGRTGAGGLVFVDYAHKPEALEHALAALRGQARGRLVLVFGCGGDRDRGKRALMGEIASRGADRVIVTDDNPRFEDAAAIRAEILAAAPGAEEIGERGQAIRRGMAMLGSGDVLLIAGKGHEIGQIVGETVLPFSDAETVRKALAESEDA